MKRIVAVLLLVSIVFSCCDKGSDGTKYIIDGKINMEYNNYVYLQKYINNEFTIVDSTKARYGEFTFKGSVNLPSMHYLQLSDKEGSFKFFLENSKMAFKVDADSVKNSLVTGSVTHDLYMKFKAKNHAFNDLLSKIYNEYKEADEEDQVLVDSLDAEYNKVEEEQFAFYNTFIQEHNNSVVSPFVIRLHMIYRIKLEELESLTASLDLSLAESEYVKWLFNRIEILRKVAIGKLFTDFTMNDIDESPFSLSQLKGNVVLIDFWASGCGPCRRENPNVVKIYNKFHSEGFEILGVSFDKDYDKWLEAINEDQLTWYHVSDLQGWNNTAGKIYGVMSIPHTLLLDRDGIIVAKNIRGEELEEKVKELLGVSMF